MSVMKSLDIRSRGRKVIEIMAKGKIRKISRKLEPRQHTQLLKTRPISGISAEQYAKLVQYFSGQNSEGSQVVKAESLPTVSMAGKLNIMKSWVIDSGATQHITCNRDILENQTTMGTKNPVKIPNGDVISVKSIRDTNLPNGLKINHVLNIPDSG